MRRLRSNVPTRVTKYTAVIREKWKYHKISSRFLRLKKNFDELGKNNYLVKELNALDKQITEIMIHSEKKCSNVPSHNMSGWSVQLKETLKHLMKTSTRRTNARKMSHDVQMEDAIKNYQYTDDAWEKAKAKYDEVKKNRNEYRNNHLIECARITVEKNDNITLANEIKRLSHIEENNVIELRD